MEARSWITGEFGINNEILMCEGSCFNIKLFGRTELQVSDSGDKFNLKMSFLKDKSLMQIFKIKF